MPSFKPDLKITAMMGEKSFSIGGLRLPDGRYVTQEAKSAHFTTQRLSTSASHYG